MASFAEPGAIVAIAQGLNGLGGPSPRPYQEIRIIRTDRNDRLMAAQSVITARGVELSGVVG